MSSTIRLSAVWNQIPVLPEHEEVAGGAPAAMAELVEVTVAAAEDPKP